MVAPNFERMFRVCNFTVSGDTLREDAISSLVHQQAIMVKFHFLSLRAWEESANPIVVKSHAHPCLFWRDLMGLGYRTHFVSRYQSFRQHSIAQLTVLINRVRSAVDVNFSQIDKNARFRACSWLFMALNCNNSIDFCFCRWALVTYSDLCASWLK